MDTNSPKMVKGNDDDGDDDDDGADHDNDHDNGNDSNDDDDDDCVVFLHQCGTCDPTDVAPYYLKHDGPYDPNDYGL